MGIFGITRTHVRYTLWLGLLVLLMGGTSWLWSSANTIREYDISAAGDASGTLHALEGLSANWSMEISQIQADPNSGFDTLVSFIPLVKTRSQALQRYVDTLETTDGTLHHAMQVYLNTIERQEEAIERVKSAHAAQRNSVQYLPLVSGQLLLLAQEHEAAALAERIMQATQAAQTYQGAPTPARKEVLAGLVETLQAEVDRVPSPLRGTLINLIEHINVVLEHAGRRAKFTADAVIAPGEQRAERLHGLLNESLQRAQGRARVYEIGAAAGATSALIVLLFMMTGRLQSARREADPEPRIVESGAALPAPAAALSGSDARPAAAALPTNAIRERELRALIAARIERIGDGLTEVRRTVSDGGFRALSDARNVLAHTRDVAQARKTLDSVEFALRTMLQPLSAQRAGLQDLARSLGQAWSPERTVAVADLNACIKQSIEALQLHDTVRVLLSLDEVPLVRGDSAAVSAVLTELLGNARDAAAKRANPSVKIDTLTVGARVMLTIVDNGGGIDMQQGEGILLPFRTTHETRTGIGFSVVTRVTIAYGAEFKLSTLPGHGTCARVLWSPATTVVQGGVEGSPDMRRGRAEEPGARSAPDAAG